MLQCQTFFLRISVSFSRLCGQCRRRQSPRSRTGAVGANAVGLRNSGRHGSAPRQLRRNRSPDASRSFCSRRFAQVPQRWATQHLNSRCFVAGCRTRAAPPCRSRRRRRSLATSRISRRACDRAGEALLERGRLEAGVATLRLGFVLSGAAAPHLPVADPLFDEIVDAPGSRLRQATSPSPRAFQREAAGRADALDQYARRVLPPIVARSRSGLGPLRARYPCGTPRGRRPHRPRHPRPRRHASPFHGRIA